MKLCRHCQNPVPRSVEINGKKIKLTRGRRACLACRPYKCFSSKTPERMRYEQDLLERGLKQCSQCLGEKPLNLFTRSHTRKIGFQPFCNECRRPKRNQTRNGVKGKAIQYLGGKCVCCGYNACQKALQFHHIDPSQKDFNISRLERSWESIKPEIDKCALVCSNCHFEIHAGAKKLPKG